MFKGLSDRGSLFFTVSSKMTFGKTCISFCAVRDIGKWNFSNGTTPVYEFDQSDFQRLCDLNVVYDGTHGGLILGNSHLDGGIHLIQPINDNRYKYAGEMEGWEYLTFPIINEDFQKKFIHLNDSTPNEGYHIQTNFNIPSGCKVIDTTKTKIPFLLLTEYPHFIFNRFATKKHIDEIMEWDKKQLNFSKGL